MPADFLTDEEMAALEGQGTPDFISDAEMAQLERAMQPVGEAESQPVRGAAAGVLSLVPFDEQIAAGVGAAYKTVREGLGGTREGLQDPNAPAPGFIENYRQLRDEYKGESAAVAEENPVAYRAGQVGTVLTQVNPLSFARAGATGLRALLTREGAAGAGRALLSREGAKVVAGGAAVGGSFALDESESDLTRGEFGPALEDTLRGATVGAVVGGAAKGLLGAGAARQAGQAQRAAEKQAASQQVAEYDEAVAALPEQKAAAKAENAAAKQAFKEETAAAKSEAKAATKAKRQAAEAAARAPTPDKALIRAGLEGKQPTLGGPERAKLRGQALAEEPLPGDPSKKLLDEAEKLSPDARLKLATSLRRQAGAELGSIRQELAEVPGMAVSTAQVRAQIREDFANLPSEIQGTALAKIDDLLGVLSQEGLLYPQALRKLIEDSEALARYGSPNLEAALGNARGRVFNAARAVLTQNERYLIETALPQRAPEYAEALRRYSVYSDFELGSKVILTRANKGEATIRYPKSDKITPEIPRVVPKPQLRPEPKEPEFPGGEEALARARKLLEPKPTIGRRLLRAGELVSEGASVVGLPLAGKAATGFRLLQRVPR